MRVAVLGASGFVGSALVERLWATGGCEVQPVIHSSGSAARIARFGRPLVLADLMAPQTLDRAIAGCTHVVNCSRGPSDVMTRGLHNLIEAARRAGVKRFVHLSSVAVYGDTHVGVLDETAPSRPASPSYGHTKLLQDRLVAKAVEAGLSSVVLCPPNISGPYSPFLLEIVQTIRRGQLALVEGGRRACELVDVANLVHAICLALTTDGSDGRRIFVTDAAPITWGEVAAALQPLTDNPVRPASIPLAEAERLVRRSESPPPSLLRALRYLVGADVRRMLVRDPFFARAERTAKTAIRRLPPLDRTLRKRFAEGPRVPTPPAGPALSTRLLKQQLRGVTYSPDRARRILGYTPVVTFQASMSAFTDWYCLHHGWGTEWWPLLKHLG